MIVSLMGSCVAILISLLLHVCNVGCHGNLPDVTDVETLVLDEQRRLWPPSGFVMGMALLTLLEPGRSTSISSLELPVRQSNNCNFNSAGGGEGFVIW